MVDLNTKIPGGDIRPLKGLLEVKGEFPLSLLVLLILLFAAGILAFVYFKKKRRAIALPITPSVPPEELAMRELELLPGMKLVEKGMVKEYYVRLSDIIRRFLEAGFGFSLDKTTWELYREMRERRIKRASAERIRDFLEDCDLVKFAKRIPAEKEIKEIYNSAKEIVGNAVS